MLANVWHSCKRQFQKLVFDQALVARAGGRPRSACHNGKLIDGYNGLYSVRVARTPSTLRSGRMLRTDVTPQKVLADRDPSTSLRIRTRQSSTSENARYNSYHQSQKNTEAGYPEVTRYQEVVPVKLRPNRQRTTGYGPSDTRSKRQRATVVSDVLICGDHLLCLYFLYRLRSKESYWRSK